MEKFEEILSKYKFPKRTKQHQTTVEEIKNKITFKLPEDYETFLLRYEGFETFVGKEYLRLWDIDVLINNNISYFIFNNLPNAIGIGVNGAEEFIAIKKISEKNFIVILCPFIDMNERNHIVIGKSFSDFLIQLENGNEWFTSNFKNGYQ